MTAETAPETTAPHRLGATDLPARFGRYTLTGVLGSGGMGRVFAAVMTGPSGFRKEVALKVLRTTEDEAPAELDSEARIGALLRHPNIVDIYDFGEHCGTSYISMEAVRGVDLASLAARTRLAPAQITTLGAAIAAGLQHAHELQVDGVSAGLVHRDLKPSNVLVSRDGVVKVVDFGIAKLKRGRTHTETGVAKGTPAYMSPEQASAEEVDHRSDLWSLGAMLFELASGEPLLRGMTIIELMMSLLQVHDRLARPETLAAVDEAVPGLAAIVARCLEAERNDRYPDAAAVESELLALTAELPSAPSLRALVRDVLAGGDGSTLPATEARIMGRPGGRSTIAHRPRHNLPRLTTTFLGRHEVLDKLHKSFDTAGLWTLLGPGGTGKTRLAVEAARGFLERHTGGAAWFVGAQDARDAESFVRAVGAVLEIPWRGGDEHTQIGRIGSALSTAGPTLLVLDNLEHLVDHVVEPVRRWLQLAPDLRVLATSRERLRVRGERVVDVGPLSQEEAQSLFVARAGEARRGYQPTTQDLVHIAEIVRRLDRLPLAIELAAARVAMLPPERIASRLDERFRLLRSRERGTDPRQATLEDTIAWSWDLLSEPERWTLAWCSVFRGGFTLVQAEDLVSLDAFPDAPWVLETIEALHDKSLLVEGVGVDGSPRFRMYESIRAFATARLLDLDADDDARRAAGRVLAVRAATLRDALNTNEAARAMVEVAQEEDNFFAVLETCPEVSDRAEVGLTLLRHLSRGAPQALLKRVFAQIWALLEELPTAQRAELLTLRAQMTRMGLYPKGDEDWSWQALELAYAVGDDLLAARLSIHVGYDLNGRDGADRAIAQLERAREDMRALATPAHEAYIVSALATALAYSGRRDEAVTMHREALAMHEAAGSARMVGVDAVAIGTHFALEGDLREARHWFDRGQASFKAANDLLSMDISLTNLTHLELELGNLDAARRTADRAERVRARLGRKGETSLHADLGALAALDGDMETARAHFAQAVRRVGKESAYGKGANAAYEAMADALDGRLDGVVARLESAAALFAAASSSANHALTLGNAAAVAAYTGDRERSLTLLTQAMEAADASGVSVDPMLRVVEAQLELLMARETTGPEVRAARRAAATEMHAELVASQPGVHVLLGCRVLGQALTSPLSAG